MKFDRTRLPLSHERIPRPLIYVGGEPVYILDKRSIRRTGKEALAENICVAKIMVEFVKDLFGPRRLLKMITTKEGRTKITYVTTDLRTAFSKVKLSHPVAQLIAGAAISTFRECGGGAAYTVILAGKILENCEHLLNSGVHPMSIIDGLLVALQKILEISNKLVINEELEDTEIIKCNVKMSFMGRLPPYDQEHIVKMALDIIRTVGIQNILSSKWPEVVDFKKILGGSLLESEVIDGLVFYKEIPHMNMPKRVEDARIAVVKGELRLPERKLSRHVDLKWTFEKPDQLDNFQSKKRIFLKDIARKIIDTGANVIIVEEGIDNFLLEYFSLLDILAVRRFPPQELVRVAKATGATMITDFNYLSSSDLGWARVVEEKKIIGQPWLYIRGCRNPKAIDVLLRGTTNYLLDDVERVMKGIIPLIRTTWKDKRLVWGGGAFEEEVSRILRRFSREFPDKRQLAVNAVAEAFEYFPVLLAETAGLKGIDAISELRARHAQGELSVGIDVLNGCLADMNDLRILDPLAVKVQAIRTAFETAITILRIDEYIIGRKLSEPEYYYVKRMKGTSPKRLKKLRRDYGLETLE